MARVESLKVVAVTTILFAFLYQGGYTNADTEELTKIIRVIFAAISILLTLFVFLTTRCVSRNATFIVLLIVVLCLVHIPVHRGLAPELISALLSSFAAIVIAYFLSGSEFSQKIQIFDLIILFVLAYLVALLILSEVSFQGLLPVISFVPTHSGEPFTYSQGVTKLFSVGCLAILYKLINAESSIFQKYVLVVLGIIFFVFSLAGGSRGEVVFCVLTAFVILCRNWKALVIGILCVLSVVLVYNTFGEIDNLMKMRGIVRFFESIEASTVGGRDVLLREAFELLEETPRCVFLGCDFTFFQDYYGRSFGWWPHNIFMEFIIVFGLPLLLLTTVLITLFIKRNYDHFSINERFLLVLSLYFLGVSSKSGTLAGEAVLYVSFLSVLFSVRRTVAAKGLVPAAAIIDRQGPNSSSRLA